MHDMAAAAQQDQHLPQPPPKQTPPIPKHDLQQPPHEQTPAVLDHDQTAQQLPLPPPLPTTPPSRRCHPGTTRTPTTPMKALPDSTDPTLQPHLQLQHILNYQSALPHPPASPPRVHARKLDDPFVLSPRKSQRAASSWRPTAARLEAENDSPSPDPLCNVTPMPVKRIRGSMVPETPAQGQVCNVSPTPVKRKRRSMSTERPAQGQEHLENGNERKQKQRKKRCARAL